MKSKKGLANIISFLILIILGIIAISQGILPIRYFGNYYINFIVELCVYFGLFSVISFFIRMFI